MNPWNLTYLILTTLLSAVSFFPVFGFTHWVFKIFDYPRLQLTFILLLLFILGFFVDFRIDFFNSLPQIFAMIAIVYHLITIFPYIPLPKEKTQDEPGVTLLSVNVMQKNQEYEKLIQLVREVQPDILMTMESNRAWENALSEIEDNFEYVHKIPLENRYGLHFYTKLPVKTAETHFLISKEFPSIEIKMADHEGNEFIFWGIHPPPPSPTEMPTSRLKDAELVKVANLVRKNNSPTLVAGDFNNVCWSPSSKLFAKISKLEDARIGRGFHGTFPVKPVFLRFPIDLLFHTPQIKVHELKTMPPIGSDHLPFFAKFSVPASSPDTSKTIQPALKAEAKSILKEGKKAKIEEL